ncbi:MAG: protein kinase domain-containing protein [Ktedonobacteraceae bacterium]
MQGQDEAVHAIKRWLETHSQWLLVLEDVQDPEVIEAFIPSINRGSLLLTTLVPSVVQRFPRVEMDKMKPEEQTLLLQLSRMVGATLSSAHRRMPLGIERVTIGRAQDNQLVLNDLAVSSHHAEILLKEQGYWITDMGSTNGTFVNQQMLESHVPFLLHPQDVIRISTTTFTYEVDDLASSKFLASSRPATMTPPSGQTSLPSSSEEAHVGKQLGNYRLARLIGQGGFAEVYLGEHIHLDTQAAIKVLYTKLAKDDSEAFRQEARTIARLVHPHIVRVLDFGVEGTTPFLVMDYAPGETLRELHPKGTRLSLETVVSYVKQIALALDYAHEQKVIHRDVKPENMLIGRNGEVLLSDFGIALITQSSRYESSLDMAGTIAYMAPEQIEAHARPASDQYSLGIVVYEWLTGDRPFHGSFREIAIKHSLVSPSSLIEQVPELSPAVEQVVLIALAKEPKQRFRSVLAFATALEQARLVKQIEPEPVVLLSEATAPNQSQPSAELALPAIPILQQAVSKGAVDTPVQPDTIIPSQGEERQRQIEEVNPRQAEEEQARLAVKRRLHQAEEEAKAYQTKVSRDQQAEEESLRKTEEPLVAAISSSPPPFSASESMTSSTLPPRSLKVFVDNARMFNTWGIDKQRLIAMVVGVLLYTVITYALESLVIQASTYLTLVNGSSYDINIQDQYRDAVRGIGFLFDPIGGKNLDLPSFFGILVGCAVTIPFFFGCKFGPLVGLATASLGIILSDLLLGWAVFGSSWQFYVIWGLLGFIPGLAYIGTKGHYSTWHSVFNVIILNFITIMFVSLLLNNHYTNTSTYLAASGLTPIHFAEAYSRYLSNHFYYFYYSYILYNQGGVDFFYPIILALPISVILQPILLILSEKITKSWVGKA